MRVFANVVQAHSEITRDLVKSPRLRSSRVQNFAVEASVQEAMNYAYSIQMFPMTLDEYLSTGIQAGIIDEGEYASMRQWYRLELAQRLAWHPQQITEQLHPRLAGTLEGSEPAYSYTDRMRGAVETLTRLLRAFPDTRRGFWPIFIPEDAVRSIRMTRIPCSIGYEVMIRQVGDVDYLHLTYLQRSCDFMRFWYSDIWFARQFQVRIVQLLAESMPQLKVGSFSHIVLSLHAFINSEVY